VDTLSESLESFTSGYADSVRSSDTIISTSGSAFDAGRTSNVVLEATVIPIYDYFDKNSTQVKSISDPTQTPSIGLDTINRTASLGVIQRRHSTLGFPEEFWSAQKLDTTVDLDKVDEQSTNSTSTSLGIDAPETK
jgi:hypothetical protein